MGRPGAPMKLTRLTLLVATLAHLVVQVVLTRAHHFFASEDDGYRLYQAYLLCSGQADPIGRFWLPGQLALTCPATALGVPPVWAGVLVSTASLVLLACALAALARRLAPAEQADDAAGAAFVLLLASPMAMTLAHSALAELPATAACALAALGLVVRARGGSRALLVAATLAMLFATWTRYECWPLALVFPLAAGLGHARRKDAAIAALAWLGPLGWMALQAWRFGDPFGFVHATAEITAQARHAGVLAVLAHRLQPLGLAPAALGGLGALVLATRGAWRPDRAALAFLAWMALGVLAPALTGAEHPVFPERLSFALEVGLVPLAALAWAAWWPRARTAGGRSRVLAVALVLLCLAPLLAALKRPRYLDRDSVAVGLALRAGRLAPPEDGRLLVERPEQRPPLGWASLASAWGAWPRLVFATPAAGLWELVEPVDVRARRAQVREADLAAWLDAHAVSAAWCVSPTCVKTLRLAWPGARVRALGRGRWVARERPQPAPLPHTW
jgi:hypothetical protein